MTQHTHYAASRVPDDKDNIILATLERNGRATLSDLSKASDLSISAVQSRVQKLEKNGIIEGYHAVINRETGVNTVRAFITIVPLDYSQEKIIPERLRDIQGIQTCDSISGSASYMVTACVPDEEALGTLLHEIHAAVPVSTDTTIVLSRYFSH